ncbi:MAG: hypothetical protein KDC66_09075 [Phaeodactylibacter sp.]|nr:hypothetical protein [Phaeodactylibacter sp.]
MYKLDRTVFRRQTTEEADERLAYWLSQPLRERLRAAKQLITRAWGLSPEAIPRMQKGLFKARRRMRNEIFFQDFLEFIQALQQNGVEYLLVGGYAVILYGYMRTTGDLDIWVNRPEKITGSW